MRPEPYTISCHPNKKKIPHSDFAAASSRFNKYFHFTFYFDSYIIMYQILYLIYTAHINKMSSDIDIDIDISKTLLATIQFDICCWVAHYMLKVNVRWWQGRQTWPLHIAFSHVLVRRKKKWKSEKLNWKITLLNY